MVKIKSLDEFKKILKSNYGYIIITKKNQLPTIHQPKCTLISEEEFKTSIKEPQDFYYHWFSSISLAEKEIEKIITCKNCIS